MHDSNACFDQVLSYPQWQGSGRSQHLRRGALAAAEVCGRYGPLARGAEAGEGEAKDGIHRRTAILAQFRSAQAVLAQRRPRRVLAAGGDCGCDVAVIDYLRRIGANVFAIAWTDGGCSRRRGPRQPGRGGRRFARPATHSLDQNRQPLQNRHLQLRLGRP